MLSKEDFVEIQALARRGVYQRDIAERLGVHPKTVSRALKRGGAPEGRRRPARGSKLEAHREMVDGLLTEGVWNAVVILGLLRARGYEGSITTLKDYIQPKRLLRTKRATVRFETRPGKQLQSDW
ncbi:MAG: helix-turn-helix domain-containing protein [bacterium]